LVRKEAAAQTGKFWLAMALIQITSITPRATSPAQYGLYLPLAVAASAPGMANSSQQKSHRAPAHRQLTGHLFDDPPQRMLNSHA